MVFCLTEVISYVNILHNREAMTLRRRKQRGILMDHGSILRRKRRGIQPEEIKRMSPISLSDSLNYLMKHTKA